MIDQELSSHQGIMYIVKKETFSSCCGFNHLHHSRPQRSYSVLSRSNVRGPDSTDSGSHDHTVQTNTSQKNNSMESFIGHHGKKYKTSMLTREDNEENPSKEIVSEVELQNLQHPTDPGSPTYSVLMVNSPPTTFNKFLQFFHGGSKKALDTSRKRSSHYSTPLKEPNILELQKNEKTREKEIFESSLVDRVKDKFVVGLNPGKILDRRCEESPEKKTMEELVEIALARESILKEMKRPVYINRVQKSEKKYNKISERENIRVPNRSNESSPMDELQ
ncbi:hypothetical protein JTB14_022801 [Gonioctena quinquepunctata]|nr:hypothetical protein JTB14_022801 [Gonioctena quinquepunctata]